MSPGCDWGDRPIPVFSHDFFQIFLAYVHPFTALGLESQCYGLSVCENGIIQYLSLLPQENTIDNVTSTDTLSQYDVIRILCFAKKIYP